MKRHAPQAYAQAHPLGPENLRQWRRRLEADPDPLAWRALVHPSACPAVEEAISPRTKDCAPAADLITASAGLALVAKYAGHPPLYWQSKIVERHGMDLDRSTLAGGIGGACWWLTALQ